MEPHSRQETLLLGNSWVHYGKLRLATLTLKDTRVSIYNHVNILYGPHQFKKMISYIFMGLNPCYIQYVMSR